MRRSEHRAVAIDPESRNSIAVAGDVIDYVANAAKFTVTEGDFFGTGLQETHSPLLILHDWHNVTNEVREAIPIRK